MQLKDLEGEKHLATVQLEGGVTAVAEFRLDGADTYLQLYSDEALIGWEAPEVLPAILPDGTRITFRNSIIRSAGTHSSAGEQRHFARLQPHWVALGRRHLTEDARLISLDVLVDDAPSIFYDWDAFGYSLSPEDHIDAILADNSQRIERTLTRGERPMIGYFAGRWTIAAAETALGRVSAHHRLSRSMGGPRGIRLESQIFVDLEPPSPTTLAQTIDAFMSVLRFLEMMAGRPQSVLAVTARLEGEAEVPDILEVYWPLKPRRRRDGEEPQPADLPINGGIEPEAFANVLTSWLATDATRREARLRYAEAARGQNSYGVERIIAAANMFDVLPADALPSSNQLPPELTEARAAARQIFRNLPVTPERDSVLSALGRIDQLSLKRKVRHRASLIQAVAGQRFPSLDVVVDEAVNCRNRYVHGSTTRVDYAGGGRGLVPFLTDTLEFVFGASELVEAGWDIQEWLQRGTTMSHPWGAYRVSYNEHLEMLRSLLAAAGSQ